MSKRKITTAEMRRELRAMGYTVRTKAGSSFSMATVLRDGVQVNGANVVTREHLEQHAEFYAWREGVSVVDNGWRTML